MLNTIQHLYSRLHSCFISTKPLQSFPRLCVLHHRRLAADAGRSESNGVERYRWIRPSAGERRSYLCGARRWPPPWNIKVVDRSANPQRENVHFSPFVLRRQLVENTFTTHEGEAGETQILHFFNPPGLCKKAVRGVHVRAPCCSLNVRNEGLKQSERRLCGHPTGTSGSRAHLVPAAFVGSSTHNPRNPQPSCTSPPPPSPRAGEYVTKV